MSPLIYKINSKITTKFYVGSAVNFKRRKFNHLSNLRRGIHNNRILQNHVNKYGIDDLEFEILEQVLDKEELIKREQFYIDLLCPTFNICKKAGSRLGTKHSPEVIEKLKISHKNISDETRRRMSESSKKRKASDETRKKIADAGRNRRDSDETRKKKSEAAKRRIYPPMSEEQKDKIRNAHKKRLSDPKEREKISIAMKKYFRERPTKEGI